MVSVTLLVLGLRLSLATLRTFDTCFRIPRIPCMLDSNCNTFTLPTRQFALQILLSWRRRCGTTVGEQWEVGLTQIVNRCVDLLCQETFHLQSQKLTATLRHPTRRQSARIYQSWNGYASEDKGYTTELSQHGFQSAVRPSFVTSTHHSWPTIGR